MSIKVYKEQKKKDIIKIFNYEEEAPQEKKLVYKIDIKNKKINFYPAESKFFLKEIIIDGFTYLPEIFFEKGYIKAGALYYLEKNLKGKHVTQLIISKTGKNSFRKVSNGFKVVINYDSLKKFKESLATLIYESKIDKSNSAEAFFAEIFPKKYKRNHISAQQKAGKVLKNLDGDIIKHIDASGIDRILDFFELLLKTKYKTKIKKRQFFKEAKLKIDSVALCDILLEFENNLKIQKTENEWGNFLRENIFLLDSKYINSIPELNLVLGGTRKVDFGLIDSQGYLDIFEIKLPTTKLLANEKDRGNYYWNSQAVKALVQIEKYLYNAERKATSLCEDIKREKGVCIKIIKPRALIIMGHSNQFKNEEQREDFKILRTSFKNVEIILYDELLNRLRNQSKKIY